MSDVSVLPSALDQQHIIASCTDGVIRIIDLVTATESACLKGHTGVARKAKVLCSKSSALGYNIVSAGYDGTVRVWAYKTETLEWECIRVLEFTEALQTPFGDDIKLLEIESDDVINVKLRAKRVFDLQIDGNVAYVVGEGAEIVAYELS